MLFAKPSYTRPYTCATLLLFTYDFPVIYYQHEIVTFIKKSDCVCKIIGGLILENLTTPLIIGYFTLIMYNKEPSFVFKKSLPAPTNSLWRRDYTRRICSISHFRIGWTTPSSGKDIALVRPAANETSSVRIGMTLPLRRWRQRVIASRPRSAIRSQRPGWTWRSVGKRRWTRCTSRADRRTSTAPRVARRRQSSP